MIDIGDPAFFKKQLDRLMRELSRAIRLDSPLIALAIYNSEFAWATATAALEPLLGDMGQSVKRVQISAKRPDLPQYLRSQPNSHQTVYFASGLEFGGGADGLNGYRALNLRREYLIEGRMRVVFWLTEDEAFNLPRHAPDFWVFRHRTVEFIKMQPSVMTADEQRV